MADYFSIGLASKGCWYSTPSMCTWVHGHPCAHESMAIHVYVGPWPSMCTWVHGHPCVRGSMAIHVYVGPWPSMCTWVHGHPCVRGSMAIHVYVGPWPSMCTWVHGHPCVRGSMAIHVYVGPWPSMCTWVHGHPCVRGSMAIHVYVGPWPSMCTWVHGHPCVRGSMAIHVYVGPWPSMAIHVQGSAYREVLLLLFMVWICRHLKVAFQMDSSCERKPTIEFNGELFPRTVNHTYVRTRVPLASSRQLIIQYEFLMWSSWVTSYLALLSFVFTHTIIVIYSCHTFTFHITIAILMIPHSLLHDCVGIHHSCPW